MNKIIQTASTKYLILRDNNLSIVLCKKTKRLINITEAEGMLMAWVDGKIRSITHHSNGKYVGLYQSWDCNGRRTEVSYSYETEDYGEVIMFRSDTNEVEISYYTLSKPLVYNHTKDMTKEIIPMFEDPSNPTKEEQLQVHLAYNIPLIPYDCAELRDVYGAPVYL